MRLLEESDQNHTAEVASCKIRDVEHPWGVLSNRKLQVIVLGTPECIEKKKNQKEQVSEEPLELFVRLRVRLQLF